MVGQVIDDTVDLTGYEWASKADVDALFDRHFFSTAMSATNISQYADVAVDAIGQLFVDFYPDAGTSRQSRRCGRNFAHHRRWRQCSHLVGGGIVGARGAPTTARPGDSPWLATRYGRRLQVLQASPPGPRSRLDIRHGTEEHADMIREA